MENGHKLLKKKKKKSDGDIQYVMIRVCSTSRSSGINELCQASRNCRGTSSCLWWAVRSESYVFGSSKPNMTQKFPLGSHKNVVSHTTELSLYNFQCSSQSCVNRWDETDDEHSVCALGLRFTQIQNPNVLDKQSVAWISTLGFVIIQTATARVQTRKQNELWKKKNENTE